MLPRFNRERGQTFILFLVPVIAAVSQMNVSDSLEDHAVSPRPEGPRLTLRPGTPLSVAAGKREVGSTQWSRAMRG